MSMKLPKQKARKDIYRGKIFQMVEDELEHQGHTFHRVTVLHPGAAVFLPVDEHNNLLLVRQYRHPIGQMLLEAPAGTLEPNEEPLACAKREIQEEVAMSAATWTSLGTLYPAPGFCSELQHLFLAQDLTPAPGVEQDEDEFIEVVSLSSQEVEEKILTGEIGDAKTIALFYRMQPHLT